MDLSAGGAGIRCGFAPEVQSEVTLRFRLPGWPDREPVDLEIVALVVREGVATDAGPGRSHLAGLHFLTLHGEQFDRVREHVWRLMHPENT
jgi:hypothetical protein